MKTALPAGDRRWQRQPFLLAASSAVVCDAVMIGECRAVETTPHPPCRAQVRQFSPRMTNGSIRGGIPAALVAWRQDAHCAPPPVICCI
jgi:hypothetical protein